MQRRLARKQVIAGGVTLLVLSVVAALVMLSTDDPSTPPGANQIKVEATGYIAVAAEDRMIRLVFPYEEEFYCRGQFSVSVEESDAAVDIGPVTISKPATDEGCAGIGTDGRIADLDVALLSPVGARTVRLPDGRSLPRLG